MQNYEITLQEEVKDLDTLLSSSKIIIKSEEDREVATQTIVVLKKKFDTLEELRTSFVKPLNDQVKFINGKFKDNTSKLDDAITKLKGGIASYLKEQERIAREKEEKERAKLEAKNAKREAEGKAPIIKTLESVERPEAISRVEGGKTGSRKVWKFRVTNPAEVPNEFLSPDIDKIKSAVQNGVREIKGVEIYEDFIISASAY
jgi:hypothetical protein